MNFRALTIASLLAATTPVVSPTVALAQDAKTEMARERFREGVEYYDQRQYEKARLAFLQAYALKPHPAILLNLAQSELRGGHPAAAAQHFSQYTLENPEASAAEQQESELGFAAARSKVGEVEVEIDVEGAAILVDGEEVARSPLPGPLYVDPGDHKIEAAKDGQKVAVAISVRAGGSTAATLRFVSSGGGGAAATAMPADADDDEPSAPVAEPTAEPQDDDEPMSFSTEGERKGFGEWFVDTPGAWVGAGVTGLGLIGGVVFSLQSKSSYDDADNYVAQIKVRISELQQQPKDRNDLSKGMVLGPDDTKPCTNAGNIAGGQYTDFRTACRELNDASESGDSQKLLAQISFGVGALGAVGTVVYYFVDPDAKESAGAVQVLPIAQPGVQGLQLFGRF